MTKKATIFHNPRCSKSRETLALLEDKGLDLTVVEYLKEPPSASELKTIIKKLGLKARDIVRTKEDAFKSLKIDLENDSQVIAALAKHPVLLERPIVVVGEKAALGRPPENVKKIL